MNKIDSMTDQEHRWPLDRFPALKPGDYPHSASFEKIRRSKSAIRAAAQDDDSVQVAWTEISARDGYVLDLLWYTSKFSKSTPSTPLLFAIHGGGMCPIFPIMNASPFLYLT